MTRGRPPIGTSSVDRFDAPDHVKQMLKVMLEKLSGQRTADDACAVLGISRASYYVKENELLYAAIAAIGPKPIGRPPAEKAGEPPEMHELRELLRKTQLELAASRAREQLWATVPEVAARTFGLKKGDATSR
jgi:hypothetical protein